MDKIVEHSEFKFSPMEVTLGGDCPTDWPCFDHLT